MSLRKRVEKLGGVEPVVGRRCSCSPRSWRLVTNIDPKTGEEMSEAEFERAVPTCLRCGGLGGGMKVRVVWDG